MVRARFAQNNFYISYLMGGAGPARIAFIPGLCGTAEIWAPMMRVFAPRYEVVSMEALGHGQSSAVDGSRFIPDSAAAIAGALGALPPLPTFLVGHSLGGPIVQEILSSGPPIAGAAFVDSPCLAAAKNREAYAAWDPEIRRAPDANLFIRNWFEEFLTPTCPAEVRRAVIGGLDAFSPDWIATVMKNLPAPSPAAVGARILVAEGAQYFPAGSDLSWLCHYPDAQAWMTPQRGHFFFLEDPEPFAQALQKFISAESASL